MSIRSLAQTRQRGWLGVTVGCLTLTVAACGDDGGAEGDTGSDAADSMSETTEADAFFPVTLEHGLGTTEIPAPPERVMALGNVAQDTAVALGVPLIGGVADPFNETGIYPWLEGQTDTEATEWLTFNETGSFNIEQIARLEPDLILAGELATIDDDYETLSEIAPTVGYIESNLTDPWQDTTRIVGRALGDEDGAEELIEQAETEVADLAGDYPGIEGRTWTFGSAQGPAAIGVLVNEDDYMTQFFGELGMELAPSVAALEGNPATGTAVVGLESLDILDADLLILNYTDDGVRDAIEGSPLFDSLPAVDSGAYMPVDADTAIALRAPTPLSLPWVTGKLSGSLDALVSAGEG